MTTDERIRAAERAGELERAAAERVRAGLGCECGRDRGHAPMVLGLGERKTGRVRLCSDVEAEAGTGEWHLSAGHGGTVPNNYKYPATTEGRVICRAPCGAAVVYWTVVPANKATLRGVAAAACGAGDLWDGRTGAERTEAARVALRAQALADLREAAAAPAQAVA
jgi:hypothetical protein